MKARCKAHTTRVARCSAVCARRIMIVPKAHRLATYKYLFEEGVAVARKEKHKTKDHEEIKVEGASSTIPNLHVLMLMKSLKSRGFVKESFSWQYYYWYLTNEGIEYLREYLHLPAEVMPNTLKKVRAAAAAAAAAAASAAAAAAALPPSPLLPPCSVVAWPC
jgi:small subunit ribosomal protein S10e